MRFFKPNVQKLEERRDVPGLIKALTHRNQDVRDAAAKALGHIGDAQAANPLVAALKEDVRRILRTEARQSQDEVEFAKALDPTASLARQAALRRDSVRPIVLSVALDMIMDKSATSEALVRIGPLSVAPLIAALKDENEHIRKVVTKTLKTITGQDFGHDASRWQQWWDEQKQ